MSGGDLDVAQVDTRIEHGCHECVAQHVGMHAGDVYSSGVSEAVKASGGAVSVHSGATTAELDRSLAAVADGAVDGTAYRRWQRHKDDLAAFAVDP